MMSMLEETSTQQTSNENPHTHINNSIPKDLSNYNNYYTTTRRYRQKSQSLFNENSYKLSEILKEDDNRRETTFNSVFSAPNRYTSHDHLLHTHSEKAGHQNTLHNNKRKTTFSICSLANSFTKNSTTESQHSDLKEGSSTQQLNQLNTSSVYLPGLGLSPILHENRQSVVNNRHPSENSDQDSLAHINCKSIRNSIANQYANYDNNAETHHVNRNLSLHSHSHTANHNPHPSYRHSLASGHIGSSHPSSYISNFGTNLDDIDESSSFLFNQTSNNSHSNPSSVTHRNKFTDNTPLSTRHDPEAFNTSLPTNSCVSVQNLTENERENITEIANVVTSFMQSSTVNANVANETVRSASTTSKILGALDWLWLGESSDFLVSEREAKKSDGSEPTLIPEILTRC